MHAVEAALMHANSRTDGWTWRDE